MLLFFVIGVFILWVISAVLIRSYYHWLRSMDYIVKHGLPTEGDAQFISRWGMLNLILFILWVILLVWCVVRWYLS